MMKTSTNHEPLWHDQDGTPRNEGTSERVPSIRNVLSACALKHPEPTPFEREVVANAWCYNLDRYIPGSGRVLDLAELYRDWVSEHVLEVLSAGEHTVSPLGYGCTVPLHVILKTGKEAVINIESNPTGTPVSLLSMMRLAAMGDALYNQEHEPTMPLLIGVVIRSNAPVIQSYMLGNPVNPLDAFHACLRLWNFLTFRTI